MDESVRYYCFNKHCKISIFYSENCTVTEVPLSLALTDEHICTYCKQPLVSKSLLRIGREVNELLESKSYSSFIIDDDLDYHITAKELFKSSKNFNAPKHLTNANDALKYLIANKCKPNLIPDCIFLDVNMPAMDAWEFLEEFETISTLLQKNIDIYIISSNINADYHERIKSHPNVKGFVAKGFDLDFLNNL